MWQNLPIVPAGKIGIILENSEVDQFIMHEISFSFFCPFIHNGYPERMWRGGSHIQSGNDLGVHPGCICHIPGDLHDHEIQEMTLPGHALTMK